MASEVPPAWAPDEVTQLHWERQLRRDGLPPDPVRKQLRGPRGTPERNRIRNREFPIEDHKLVRGRAMQPDQPDNWLESIIPLRPGDTPRVSTQDQMEELAHTLDDAMRAVLSTQDREIFYWWSQGGGPTEIAEAFGMAPSQVHVKISSAQKKLRRQLQHSISIQEHIVEDVYPQTFEQAAQRVGHAIDYEARRKGGITSAQLVGLHQDLMEQPDNSIRWLTLGRGAIQYGQQTLDISEMSAVSWAETLASKHKDYGPMNILKFGHDGLVVRTWDKIARIRNLENTDSAAQNEPIVDSVMDLVGYCMIALMLINGTFELPLEET